MENDDIRKKLESVTPPEFSATVHEHHLKLALVSAERSAALGVWLVAVPAFFLACVFMKYYFHVNLHLIDVFEEMVSDLDKTPFLTPILLVAAPLVGFVLNILAVLFVSFDTKQREVVLRIKLRWLNLLLALVSIGIVSIFILYAFIENIHHNARP